MEPMKLMISITLQPRQQLALSKRMKLRTLTKQTARAALEDLIEQSIADVVAEGDVPPDDCPS